MFRGRICKRLRSPASAYVAWWRAGTITLFVALARQATYAGGIDSLESIPELLKSLKIPSQGIPSCSLKSFSDKPS